MSVFLSAWDLEESWKFPKSVSSFAALLEALFAL